MQQVKFRLCDGHDHFAFCLQTNFALDPNAKPLGAGSVATLHRAVFERHHSGTRTQQAGLFNGHEWRNAVASFAVCYVFAGGISVERTCRLTS